jgi:hypothetical protein
MAKQIREEEMPPSQKRAAASAHAGSSPTYKNDIQARQAAKEQRNPMVALLAAGSCGDRRRRQDPALLTDRQGANLMM